MPTVGENLIRTHALGRLNRLKKLRAEKMKKTSSDRTPMLSQVGEVLKRSGYEHEKPADIIKRVIAKGKVLPEPAAKMSLSEAGPTSSHHQLGARRTSTLDIGMDSTNPKLAGSFLPRIGAAIGGKLKGVAGKAKPVAAPRVGTAVKAVKTKPAKPFVSTKWTGGGGGEFTGRDVSRALGSDPNKGWERLGEEEAREMLKHALLGAVAGMGARVLGGLARGVGRVAGPKAGIGTMRAGKAVGGFASRRPITAGAMTHSMIAPQRGSSAPPMMPTLSMGAR
jgi:hypothetical protein